MNESRRLLEVLDAQLAKSEYLAGDEFSIADIATYPWARSFYWAKVSIDGLAHLQGGFDRLDDRPGIQRALKKPKPFPAFFGKGDVADAESFNAGRFKS